MRTIFRHALTASIARRDGAWMTLMTVPHHRVNPLQLHGWKRVLPATLLPVGHKRADAHCRSAAATARARARARFRR